MPFLPYSSLFFLPLLCHSKTQKFVLYDTNPGEGFNLRRDVYIRIANLVKGLNEMENKQNTDVHYTLVLPPWGRIGYHWGYSENQIPWKDFFNIDALNKHIPVIEFEEFNKKNDFIDNVWYLQHYKEGWGEKFEEKVDDRECINPNDHHYQSNKDGTFSGWFYGYRNMKSKQFKCVSAQGMARVLIPKIRNEGGKSVFLDRAETVLHDKFGQLDYWSARRSMQFSKKLFDEAIEFEKENGLISDEDAGHNQIGSILYLGENWNSYQPKNLLKKPLIGGNYIACHLRRRDFLRMQKQRNIPSMKGAGKFLLEKAEQIGVEKIYVATDADEPELKQLKKVLGNKLLRFVPKTPEKAMELRKGGIAIIDQIICSHAKWFIGTEDSTFSFRINEERSILGFSKKSTYNRFCKDGKKECGTPTFWEIIYDAKDEMY